MITGVKGKKLERKDNPRESFTEELRLMSNERIGHHLRHIRMMHNSRYPDNRVSQEALSKEVDVSFGTVNRMENGKSGMQLPTLVKIAAFWGMSVQDMLADIPTPTFNEVFNSQRIKRILEDNVKQRE